MSNSIRGTVNFRRITGEVAVPSMSGRNSGPPGPPNTLVVGTVEGLPYGYAPIITITGESPDQVINFWLPEGSPGPNLINDTTDTTFSGLLRGVDGKIVADTSDYLTSADLSAYATEQWVGEQGFLTAETDPVFGQWLAGNPLSDYLTTQAASDTYQVKGNYLTSETDPVFGQWLAGNPLSGFLTAETDPVFGQWLAGNPLSGFLTAETDPVFGQWLAGNPLSGYLTTQAASDTYQVKGDYLTAETDPVFGQWLAGNPLAGFLTEETDPVFGQWLASNPLSGFLTAETDPVFGQWLAGNPLSGYLTTQAASDTYQVKGSYLTAESDPVFGQWLAGNPLAGFLTAETDPVFGQWLAGNPLAGFLTAETDPVFNQWLSTTPPLYSESDPLSLHLDQTTPQTFTAGTVSGNGLLKVVGGTLGLDTSTYLEYESAGMLVEPVITDIGGGQVSVGSGTYVTYSDANYTLPLVKTVYAGATFTLVDGAVNYLKFNGATGTLVCSTSRDDIHQSQVIPVATYFRDGTTLHKIPWDHLGKGIANKFSDMWTRTVRFREELGSLVLSEAATRVVKITEGGVWTGGANRIAVSAFDSSTDTLELWYPTGVSTFAKTVVTQYENAQYANGTGLSSLTGASKYAVNWIYRSIETGKVAYIMLGGGDYSERQALDSQIPALPPVIQSFGLLVGRIIVKNGESTAAYIDSAFSSTFSSSGSETDTLATVTGRGATTTTPISISGGTTTGITDILVNPAVKASGNLADWQIGNVSKGKLGFQGNLEIAGVFLFNGGGIISKINTSPMTLSPWGSSTTSAAGATGYVAIRCGDGTTTNIRTGGNNVWLQINSNWNQATGNAADTDVEINRTNTAVGSGRQLFWDAKLGGVSISSLNTAGVLSLAGLSVTGTSDIVTARVQTTLGQTSTTAAFQAGDISGAAFFSVFPQGNISAVGGTTTGITDILVNPATKASGYLLDLQVGGASKYTVSSSGYTYSASAFASGTGFFYSTNGAYSANIVPYNGGACTAGATGLTAIKLGSGTEYNRRTGGNNVWTQLNSIWNQATGTASDTDFEINRTNIAVGSGLQLFWDCKLNTVSISSMDTAGNLRISSDAAGLKLGAGADMLVSYDGTIGKIDSSLVAPSDIHLTAGADKTLVLDTVVHKDQLGAALSLQQTGAGISRNIPEGTVDYLTTANQADYMIENFQFNHDRKAGSPVSVHIHWMQAETNTPNWAIQYRWQLGGTAKTTSWTAAKWSSNAFPWSGGTINQISTFAALTPTSNEGLSPILQVRFVRDTTNALGLAFGADPYTATVAAIAVDAHLQVDTLGSRLEYTK